MKRRANDRIWVNQMGPALSSKSCPKSTQKASNGSEALAVAEKSSDDILDDAEEASGTALTVCVEPDLPDQPLPP